MAEGEKDQTPWDQLSRHDQANIVHAIVQGVFLGLDEDPSTQSAIEALRKTPGLPEILKSSDPKVLTEYQNRFKSEKFPQNRVE